VPQPPAAALEFGGRPERERIVAYIALLDRPEVRIAREDGARMCGIVGPIRCDMNEAAVFEDARELRNECRLNQAALVMALFRPRIREEQIDGIETLRREHMSNDLDRIALHDAYVVKTAALDEHEQMPDAGLVDFDAEIIDRPVVGRGRQECLAVAEADIEHTRRAARENGVEIELLLTEREAPARPQALERALLRRRDAARPPHEASDLAQRYSVHRGILGDRGNGLRAVQLFARRSQRRGAASAAIF
jgi:hypothetical protein